jgi:hypothetical protein
MALPFRRILVRWLELSSVATALCLLLYLVFQHTWREGANSPQVQMARDAAARLATGHASPASVVPPGRVDYSTSLVPFLMVVSNDGVVLASSGTLRAETRTVPSGALDHVRSAGESRLTWQPEPGVRLATVIERYDGAPPGFVVAGRSLSDTQEQIGRIGRLILVGWLGMLAGLGLLTAGLESAIGIR